MATVIAQRFAKENKPYPKLQALIYPWLQLFNFRLPSFLDPTNLLPAGLNIRQFGLIYFGFKDKQIDELEPMLERNEHILVLKNMRETVKKFDAYFDMTLIPDEYKRRKEFYDQYEKMREEERVYPLDKRLFDAQHIFNRDENVRDLITKMFSLEMFPMAADDKLMSKLPKTYFAILEWDILRDEALLYAGRLKKLNVSVDISFYEDIFHGCIAFDSPNMRFAKVKQITDDLVNYLRKNL